MADVSTYRRCTTTYVTNANVAHQIGEVLAASDPAVVANPTLWVALTDAELASGEGTVAE